MTPSLLCAAVCRRRGALQSSKQHDRRQLRRGSGTNHNSACSRARVHVHTRAPRCLCASTTEESRPVPYGPSSTSWDTCSLWSCVLHGHRALDRARRSSSSKSPIQRTRTRQDYRTIGCPQPSLSCRYTAQQQRPGGMHVSNAPSRSTTPRQHTCE